MGLSQLLGEKTYPASDGHTRGIMPKQSYEGRAHRKDAPATEKHCGELLDHAPHSDGKFECPGGPYASPGATKLK